MNATHPYDPAFGILARRTAPRIAALSTSVDLHSALQAAGMPADAALAGGQAPAPGAGVFDLVVIDPLGWEEEQVAWARAQPGLEGAPALVIGGAPGDDVWALAQRLGAGDALARPLDARALTARLRLLAELSRSRREITLLDGALGQSANGIVIADPRLPDVPLVYANQGFARLTGYAREACVGQNCRFLQGPGTDREKTAQMRAAIAAGEPSRTVIRNYRKDGAPFWNDVAITPVHDALGKLAYLIGVQQDVTEAVDARTEIGRMTESLADRNQFISAILDGIPTAVVVTDLEGRITFINQAACATLDTSPEQCLGADLKAALQLPEGAGESPSMRGDRVRRFTYTFRRPDGTDLEIGLSMSCAEGGSAHGLGCFIIFRDIEEGRQLEMNGRRVERLAAMGTMAAGFAHEVRNPLASLRILGEALEAEMDPGDARIEFVTRMMQQLERIERLVKTSLQFGRPDPPRRAKRRAAAIVDAAVEAIQARTRGMGGAIRAEVEPELPPVYVDDAQMVQVLVTLLNNALDATGKPEGVVLRARVNAPSGRAESERLPRSLRFEVVDDGPGIPDRMISRIFDPFFTTKASGTGLGLSIAQQIVQENRGRIEVSSTPGRGTTFAVIVPGGAR